MRIIAHDIRSLHNVGSILRNAATFGIERLYLTGITGTPPRAEIAKVSLGAEDLVPWEKAEITEVIAKCKADGYAIVGLETGEGSININNLQANKIALILGNEVNGLDTATRNQLDVMVEIPMAKKRSLNVSVASGVAMYALNLQKKN